MRCSGGAQPSERDRLAGRGKISQQTTYQVSYSGGHWVGNGKLGCAQANAGIRKLLLQLEEEDGGERCAAGTREVEGGDKSEGDEERDEDEERRAALRRRGQGARLRDVTSRAR